MTVGAVRVNQVGYPAGRPVRATVATAAVQPLTWALLDPTGTALTSGKTTVLGFDPAAGEPVHTIVFTPPGEPGGDGWQVVVEGVPSPRFALGAAASRRYRELSQDALRFLRFQRSGTPIADERFGHPAGHVDVSPNRGDGSVPCRRPNCPRRRRIFGCRGHDLRGGWYDAGDHGKYAVTTASTAWLLQYAHERARPAAPGALPEVLVEARWGLEWLLAAQLPGGDPQAGMVFHAVHDLSWTGLPLRPDQDPQPRTVRAPSTAATYGLAAVAAQAARVWEPYDAAFAARCTTAADQAWTAATTLPPAYARPEENVGGGPYDDDDVRDERYWAAAELAALTGADVYRYELHTTALDLNTALRNGFDWRSTAPLGLLTQALAPGWTAAADAAGARSLLTEAAAAIPSDGHGSPLTTYGWGSNARVLAHALVLPSADACLDYLLGRNALDTSYVTGYGTHTPTQPHHRFFAQALDPAYPPPPPGILVGGPNTGREDPVAAGALPESTPPQRCWVDDIGSWSTNEVSIGWNAALAVVAARSLRVRPCFIGQQPGVAAPGRRPAAPRLRPARITLRAA